MDRLAIQDIAKTAAFRGSSVEHAQIDVVVAIEASDRDIEQMDDSLRLTLDQGLREMIDILNYIVITFFTVITIITLIMLSSKYRLSKNHGLLPRITKKH